MTLTEVQLLTPDQLRVELAKALGWTRDECGFWHYASGPTDFFFELPRWPTSLDAIARLVWPEIERRGLQRNYARALNTIVDIPTTDWGWMAATATPLRHSQAALVALTEAR